MKKQNDRSQFPRSFYSLRRAALALMTLGATGAVVMAHACLSGQFNSVHFNSGMPDFGTPPRRGVVYLRGERATRLVLPDSASGDDTPAELSTERDQNLLVAQEKERQQLLESGRKAEQSGQWREAKRGYATLAKKQGWTGFLRDRVAILAQLADNSNPANIAFQRNVVPAYFASVSFAKPTQPLETVAALDKIAGDAAADWLRERARYQAASVLAEAGDTKVAIARYTDLLHTTKQAAIRENTLLMLARTAILPEDEAKRDLKAGEAALNTLEYEFPKTRYRASVRGLRARIHFLRGQYDTAAKEYLALHDLRSVALVQKKLTGQAQSTLDAPLLADALHTLTTTPRWNDYAQAVTGVDRRREQMSAGASHDFARLLQSNPQIASDYLYYRLYHTRNRAADLKSLTLLADTLAARYPGTKLPAPVRVRLAEVYYQRHSYDRALQWVTGTETEATRDRVLYVRGAIRQKQGQSAAAMRDFAALLTRCPNSPLRHTARENLAILQETTNDRVGALDHYFALNYQSDIAFLLDIRMTTGEIERCYLTHTKQPQHDLLAYTLGIRYLRDERWREAELWLKRVSPAKYAEFNKGRHEEFFRDTPGPDPLDAVRDLSRLYRAINTARSDNARAAALFVYASYYSTHGTLLLYNVALWHGERETNFQFWWNDRQATAQDTAAVRNYMFSHEVYSRSRRICLELARRYPAAPVAPAALYRAACAARRLANFNIWWNAENKRHNYWDESTRLMNRLAETYPKSPQAAHARKYAKVFQEEKKTWQ